MSDVGLASEQTASLTNTNDAAPFSACSKTFCKGKSPRPRQLSTLAASLTSTFLFYKTLAGTMSSTALQDFPRLATMLAAPGCSGRLPESEQMRPQKASSATQ